MRGKPDDRDALTGLGNFRYFHERLQWEFDGASPQDSSLALCLIDVDDLERVSDRYGFQAGEQLLVLVAEELRRHGQAFRLGADDFAILLPGHTEAQGMEAAKAIIKQIAELPQEHDRPITVSAGVAAFPAHASDHVDLYQLADAALYWAKAKGKNQANAHNRQSGPS